MVSPQYEFLRAFKDYCNMKGFITLIAFLKFPSSMKVFYVLEDDCDLKRLYHKNYIHMTSLQYKLFYAFREECTVKKLYQIDCICKFLSFCVYVCVFNVAGNYDDIQRLYHIVPYIRFPSSMCSFKY